VIEQLRGIWSHHALNFHLLQYSDLLVIYFRSR